MIGVFVMVNRYQYVCVCVFTCFFVCALSRISDCFRSLPGSSRNIRRDYLDTITHTHTIRRTHNTQTHTSRKPELLLTLRAQSLDFLLKSGGIMFPLLRSTQKIYSTQFLTAINTAVSGEESVSEAEPGLI